MKKVFISRNDVEELEMDLTGTCNLKCFICTRNFKHSQHMVKNNIRPMSEIIKQLDTFKNLKRFFIAGTLSEPTLHPEFLQFLEYLNSRNISYELCSNANTHNIEWWKKIGEIVPDYCKMIFTICGSTQELHEKYRRGSNLQQILDHANAYRSAGKKNDWIQHILFEYNQEDFKSGNMNNIFNQFSHVMQVHSEGCRMQDEKIIEPPEDVIPPKRINNALKYIFKQQPALNTDIQLQCKIFNAKSMYIDQFGNIYPCYTYAEYGFKPFDINSDIFDYTDILNYSYKPCFVCSKHTHMLAKKFKLDFIC